MQVNHLSSLSDTDFDFFFVEFDVAGAVSDFIPTIVVKELMVRVLEDISNPLDHLDNRGGLRVEAVNDHIAFGGFEQPVQAF